MNNLPAILESSGINDDQLKVQIQTAFESFVSNVKEWADKANAIVVKDVDDEKGMVAAKGAADSLKTLRLEITKTHQRLKSDSLAVGKTLDLLKRELLEIVEPAEKRAKYMANFAEEKEKEEQEALRQSRKEEFANHGLVVPEGSDLGVMTADLYDMLKDGLLRKQQERIDAQKAEQKKAEEEKLARDKEFAKTQADLKKQREENEKLRKEQEETNRRLEAEKAKQIPVTERKGVHTIEETTVYRVEGNPNTWRGDHVIRVLTAQPSVSVDPGQKSLFS